MAILLALAGAACGGREKARVQPPAPPPMPPGVTWGRAGESASASAPIPPHPSPAPSAAANSPAPPFAADLDRPLRAGEVWQIGTASYYGPQEQGQITASGVPFDYHRMTAAHRTLPFGTRVRVTYLATGRSVVVTINDRGPFWPKRVIDLSLGAARRIGLYDHGLGEVKIKIVSLPHPVPPGEYTVQVGWFTNGAQARRCRRQMARDAAFRVIEFHSREGAWLRYDHGAALDASAALRIAADLRAADFPAYVVRLN